jgi:uncharacterized glyoxalase superfamily protein PhnB
MAHPFVPPGFSLAIMCQDIDTQYKRAVDAGCTGTMPPTDTTTNETVRR